MSARKPRAPWRIFAGLMPENRAIALVASHCDIVERLEVVPPSAQVRGVWIRAIERQLSKRGRLDVYRDYFPDDQYSALGFYPLADCLVRLASAGALSSMSTSAAPSSAWAGAPWSSSAPLSAANA